MKTQSSKLFELNKRIVDILELSKKAKLKSDKKFLEDFYNHNFRLSTDKSRMIESAYKYQDMIGLSIERRDYSNIYDIKLMSEV